MKYLKFERFVSKPRLDRFLIACGNDQERALELYKANIIISKSFYPILHLFEVFIRNTLNSLLINHFSDPDWIRTQKNIFMNDPSLKPSSFFLKTEVSKTETKLAKKGITITPGKIISEQTLGFWTSLFETHHYKLLNGSIIHCFPLKPSSINRSSISIKLNRIRDFRNRVFHNEQICFKGTSIDFNDIQMRITKAKRI